jgi:hypothetical protein
MIKLVCFLLLIAICSCQDDTKEIVHLLQSNSKDDLIDGAYRAGESGDIQFVPLLLKDANNVRRSTKLKFLGYNVYQAKMIALGKIFKVHPPADITDKPDSAVIRFYTDLWGKTGK